jgi:hypothetical protein
VLRVVAATSFAPVLDTVAPGLSAAPDCIRLLLTRADGRAAAGVAAQAGADVWIPDDPSWPGLPGGPALARTADAGSVLATSPIYLVTDPATGARLAAAGRSWLGLARMVEARQARLVTREPGGSADGLIGMGAVAESVWTQRGMDASTLWLARAIGRTRTVSGSGAALPVRAGEVGLVPEYALPTRPDPARPGSAAPTAPGATGTAPAGATLAGAAPAASPLTVLACRDVTALLRWTWQPTTAGLAEPRRAAALDRLRAALTGSGAAAALRAAGLRDATAVPPGGATPGAGTPAGASPAVAQPAGARSAPSAPVSVTAPEPLAKPLDVLGRHHVDHVLATWYPADRRTDALVVVDVSGSMGEDAPGTGTPLIDLVRDGVRSAARLLPDDARLGLWEFGTRLDGSRDHRPLLAEKPLTAAHRKALARRVGALRARATGTGLHDTILAAYARAVADYRPDVLNQVMVFTDGRNEHDPGGLSARRLAAKLRAVRDDTRPVQLSVVSFGDPAVAKPLERAVAPIDGYVDPLGTPDDVAAVFIHLAAGGLHH